MNAWILIPCGFGLWWLASGLAALGPVSGLSWAALIAVAAVVAACGLVRRGQTGLIDRRMFRSCLLMESAGIVIVLVGCGVARRPDLIMPMIGTVVGLHFLPLSRAFGDRRFIVAGYLMTGLCLASLLWPVPMRTAIAGIGAGIILWGFALWTSLQPGHDAGVAAIWGLASPKVVPGMARAVVVPASPGILRSRLATLQAGAMLGVCANEERRG